MRTIRSRSNSISATKEDYIRAIYLLESKSPVGVTDIADKLKLSKSTVSERIKDLVRGGLVQASPYSDVTLTPVGKKTAKVLTYKHRIIEVFLNKTLGLSKNEVHAEAERLEHACSDEMIKKLAKFLKYPTVDPHGTKIETPQSW